MFSRISLLTLLGILITVVGGVVYGQLSHRWGPSADLQAAADRLHALPEQLGEWKLVTEQPINEFVQASLKSAGYINRVYKSESTGEEVNIFIVVGPPGPIAVHTPEVCYSSNAYPIQTRRSPIAITNTKQMEHQFWTLKFRRNNAAAEELTVYYAWSDGQHWMASESPRFEFAGDPLLFKLQAAVTSVPFGQTSDAPPGFGFFQALLDSDWSLPENGQT